MLFRSIPAYGENISVIEEQTEGIVNINKATESELMTLPGIGSSRAADIVRYRTDYGCHNLSSYHPH